MKLVKCFLAIVLCMALLVSQVACTAAEVNKAVNLVVTYLPTAIQLAEMIIPLVAGATANASADPAVTVDMTNVGNDIVAGLHKLQKLGGSYLANPDKGTFQQMLDTVDTLVQESDQELFRIAHLKDVRTQTIFLAALGSVDAALHVIDGYLLQTQSSQQIQQRAQLRQIKLHQIKSSLDIPLLEQKAREQGTSFPTVYRQLTAQGF